MNSPVGTGAGGWHGFAIEGDLHTCWLCQRSVAAKTLRCPNCGALQPFHDLNHFALFSLEPRFDLDLETLERNYAAARRALDPERLVVKNPRAGALAGRYSDAMATAFETLRNPVSRARYLLELLDQDTRERGEAVTPSPEPALGHDGTPRRDLDDLAHAIETATDCPTIDRLAAQASRTMETCIHSLSSAFRSGRIGEARLALVHLNRLETLLATARRHRLDLCPPPGAPASED